MNRITPVTCFGYHVIEPIYIDDDSKMISLPWNTDDVAETYGWTTTTNRKFNMDGKSVVWLCPDCSKRWAEERQTRIRGILGLTLSEMDKRQFFNLFNELCSLDATKEEIEKFLSRLFVERPEEAIK